MRWHPLAVCLFASSTSPQVTIQFLCVSIPRTALRSGIGRETAAALCRRGAKGTCAACMLNACMPSLCGILLTTILSIVFWLHVRTAFHGPALAAYMIHSRAVVLACRNVAKGDALKAELERETVAAGLPRPSLEVRQLDLSSLKCVTHVAVGCVCSGVKGGKKQKVNAQIKCANLRRCD